MENALIRLEDGRALRGSAVTIDLLLARIGREIPDSFAYFRAWLSDQRLRDNPCGTRWTDLGGIECTLRSEFYAAAKRLQADLTGDETDLPECREITGLLGRFLAMKASMENGDDPLALSDCDEPLEQSYYDEQLIIREWSGNEDLRQIWG